MAYDLAKVTANGNNLIAQILANKSSLSVDKIEISDTQLPSTTDISTMTSVPKVVQTVSANGFSKNSNTLIISTVVDNSSISADYKAWVFGIWGSDSQNGQSQLIAVITSTNSPDTIPAFSGRTPVSYTYKFNIGFSNASQIQFNMIDDSFATNDTVVHTTGDETIDGQKKFKTDPTDGAGNAYAKTVDVNQQLDKKVVDNKDGTEQLNGVQVQPYNKLSDTIGGRNLLINTQNPSATNRVKFANAVGPDILGTATFSNGYIKLASSVSSTASETFYRFNHPDFTLMPLPSGTYTLVVDLTSSDNVYVGPSAQFSTNGNTIQPLPLPMWKPSSTEQRFYYTFTIPSNATGWYISLEMYTDINGTRDNTGKSFQFRNVSIQKGSVATDSSPAPEDKVNVTDMRKPASDVAGIEEVNAKQDKIGYTPADDSQVAHLSGANNFDTIPTVKNNPLLLASSLPSDLARTGQANTFNLLQTFSQGIKTLQTGSYDDANSLVNEGLYFNTNLSIKNGAGDITAGFIQVMSGYWDRVRQFMYSDVTNNLVYTRVSSDNGSTWSNWVQIITSDQIPTDLARTGQDTNFTAKLQQKGQDVATANDLKSMNQNVLHRDSNTGKATDAIDFDPGKLTTGGHPVFAIVMCTDEADAKAKSAADPNTFYVYPKES